MKKQKWTGLQRTLNEYFFGTQKDILIENTFEITFFQLKY
jgi:hypothetical protein